MESVFVRIDNRLVHGQVIEAWLPYTGARAIIVVNDELALDDLQQEIMSLAIPQSFSSFFVSVDGLPDVLRDISDHVETALVLFSSCLDVRRAFEKGFSFPILNVGNLHYAPGKRQLSPSVAVNSEDESCLRFFLQKGVDLDFRCVPNDPVQVRFI